ncbi:uncharacterized protein LOC115288528 [Suricata suricatta]|uniref:uncharacterized protein LOC115288528 n=1 Tax=Suricata suricatta TaxID=37032 RepID=UPI00115558A7|nr:uncharacterized protein LOC115288528 [Suricata suricatta]XP_029791786.1 uncharacterized protein LOC115288528 [Suricata suricatta]
MGQLPGQVGEEGPCAQHDNPEDGQADPGGQWAVPGSILLHRGIENDQYFHLSVYEPVSRPQILAEILSLTRDWCNVTLECHLMGTTGAVTVSWESKGLPRELEQTGALGPAPTPWTLALHLPLSWPSPSVTCVVNNPVDQKTATRDLGEVCGHVSEGETGPCRQDGAIYRLSIPRIISTVASVLLSVTGVCLMWRFRKPLQPTTCRSSSSKQDRRGSSVSLPMRPPSSA